MCCVLYQHQSMGKPDILRALMHAFDGLAALPWLKELAQWLQVVSPIPQACKCRCLFRVI